MNNEWLSTADIASLLNLGERRIRDRAISENWLSRPRKGRGGGREYQICGLPVDIQALAVKSQAEQQAKLSPTFATGQLLAEQRARKRQRDEVQLQKVREQGAVALSRLQGKARARAEAKLTIIAAWAQYLSPYIATHSKVAGEQDFADAYNRRELDLDAKTYQTITKLSWVSVRRWVTTLESDGSGALGGRYDAEKPHLIDADVAMQSFCRGLTYNEPDIQAVSLREAIRSQIDLGKLESQLPSESACRRWLRAFNQEFELALAQLRNPDDFKNRRQVAWGSASEAVACINQLWELDSTPSDVLLTDGRHSIVGAIDVFSRRPIVIVHPTSSAEAVCLLLRKAILEFGVPEVVKTDNGRDYTSKRVMSVLTSLGIEQRLAKPFSGDEKPHIERFFKTWAHGISKLLPGYGGHNVAKRQELRARQSFADRILAKRRDKGNDGKIRVNKGEDVRVELSAKELQAIIDQWIADFYMQKPHRMLGATPFAKWQSQRTPIRTIGDERALDLLLSPVPSSGGRPAGVRVANKDAGLVVETISYVAPELGARIGQPLYCSWDPCDISQLFVFEPETMAFICLAKNPELAGLGMSFSDLSREARRQQNAAIAEQKKPLRKASSKVSVGSVAMDVLAASTARNNSLTALPHPTEDHQTAALRGASQASKYDPTQQRMDRTEFERRREEQLQLDQLMEAQRAQPRFRNQTEEFVYYLRQADLRQLTADELNKMSQFRQQNPKLAAMAEGVKSGEERNKASR